MLCYVRPDQDLVSMSVFMVLLPLHIMQVLDPLHIFECLFLFFKLNWAMKQISGVQTSRQINRNNNEINEIPVAEVSVVTIVSEMVVVWHVTWHVMDGWVAIVDTDDDTGDTHQDCHHAALHPDHHHQYALQSQSNNDGRNTHFVLRALFCTLFI